MSRRIVFQRPAQYEFDEAADWYAQHGTDLRARFVAAVEHVLEQAALNPNRYPVVFQHIHEGVVHRFPYCVYYRAHNDDIEVLAVFHTARDPSLWQTRA